MCARKRKWTENAGQHYYKINVMSPNHGPASGNKHDSMKNHLLGGNFDLSISMATTFMINTHIGLSNISDSFLTKLMALKH